MAYINGKSASGQFEWRKARHLPHRDHCKRHRHSESAQLRTPEERHLETVAHSTAWHAYTAGNGPFKEMKNEDFEYKNLLLRGTGCTAVMSSRGMGPDSGTRNYECSDCSFKLSRWRHCDHRNKGAIG